MKKLALVIAVLVGLFAISPVGAADAQTYTWTGFYLGANAGYASGSSDTTGEICTVPTSTCTVNVPLAHLTNNQWSPTLHPNGFSGGMQGGYNWQWKNLVIGAEMDMNSFVTADERSTQVNAPGFIPITIRSKVNTDWLFTFRPRIGWAADNWLFYVTGGVALTDLHARWQLLDTANETVNATAEATKAGGVVGGGIEIGLTQKLSLKAEYLYMGFGAISTNGMLVCPGGCTISTFHQANLNSSLGRVGLNWRF